MSTAESSPMGERVQPAAARLGAAGLIPFVGLSLATWLAPPDWAAIALENLASYAGSVSPALLAWFTLMLPHPGNLGLMALGFIGVWWMDRRALVAGRVPAWYMVMRTPLTAVVVCSLLVAGGSGPR